MNVPVPGGLSGGSLAIHSDTVVPRLRVSKESYLKVFFNNNYTFELFLLDLSRSLASRRFGVNYFFFSNTSSYRFSAINPIQQLIPKSAKSLGASNENGDQSY